MSHHEGVSCDSCLKSNFRGKRYKCLICFDYDLCAECHNSGTLAGGHNSNHPMQCIITRNDIDLYFAGETLANDLPHSYTCPFCGRLGFTDSTLYEHVNVSHNDNSTAVVCPICATFPGVEPNQVSDDFLNHLNVEHRNTHELEEPQVVRIRSRNHHVRLNNNRNRRLQVLNSNGATNSNIRDPIDPFTQLLSRLSDVHRLSNSSSNAPNLLPFERHANRLPFERMANRNRRQTAQSSTHDAAHSESNSNQSTPYMIVSDSKTSPANSNSLLKSNDLTHKPDTNFLLPTCHIASLADNEQRKLDILKADRSIFIQELIFASLSESFNINDVLTTKQISNEESKFPSMIDGGGSSGGESSSSLDKADVENQSLTNGDCKEAMVNVETSYVIGDKTNVENCKTKDFNKASISAQFTSSKYSDKSTFTSSSSVGGYIENENVPQTAAALALQQRITNGANSAYNNKLPTQIRGKAIKSNRAATLTTPSIISSMRTGLKPTVVTTNGQRKKSNMKHPSDPPTN